MTLNTDFVEEELQDAFELYDMGIRAGLSEQKSLDLSLTALDIRTGDQKYPSEEKIDIRLFKAWIQECKPEPKDADKLLFDLMTSPECPGQFTASQVRKYNDECGLNIQDNCLEEMMLEAGADERGEVSAINFCAMLNRIREREQKANELKMKADEPVPKTRKEPSWE